MLERVGDEELSEPTFEIMVSSKAVKKIVRQKTAEGLIIDEMKAWEKKWIPLSEFKKLLDKVK